jgi:hypothetical protein
MFHSYDHQRLQYQVQYHCKRNIKHDQNFCNYHCVNPSAKSQNFLWEDGIDSLTLFHSSLHLWLLHRFVACRRNMLHHKLWYNGHFHMVSVKKKSTWYPGNLLLSWSNVGGVTAAHTCMKNTITIDEFAHHTVSNTANKIRWGWLRLVFHTL